MSVAQYNTGKAHALAGKKYMHHRRSRYDSTHSQRSYDNGYSTGMKEVYEKRDTRDKERRK